jgi:hypothetical protein
MTNLNHFASKVTPGGAVMPTSSSGPSIAFFNRGGREYDDLYVVIRQSRYSANGLRQA